MALSEILERTYAVSFHHFWQETFLFARLELYE